MLTMTRYSLMKFKKSGCPLVHFKIEETLMEETIHLFNTILKGTIAIQGEFDLLNFIKL